MYFECTRHVCGSTPTAASTILPLTYSHSQLLSHICVYQLANSIGCIPYRDQGFDTGLQLTWVQHLWLHHNYSRTCGWCTSFISHLCGIVLPHHGSIIMCLFKVYLGHSPATYKPKERHCCLLLVRIGVQLEIDVWNVKCQPGRFAILKNSSSLRNLPNKQFHTCRSYSLVI